MMAPDLWSWDIVIFNYTVEGDVIFMYINLCHQLTEIPSIRWNLALFKIYYEVCVGTNCKVEGIVSGFIMYLLTMYDSDRLHIKMMHLWNL